MKKFLFLGSFFLFSSVYSQGEESSSENMIEETKEISLRESSQDFLSLFWGMGFVSGEVPAADIEKTSYEQSYTFLEQEALLSLWHFSSFSLGIRGGVMTGFASSSQMEKGQSSGFFGMPLQLSLGYTYSSFQAQFLLGYFYHTHFIPNTSLSSSFFTINTNIALDIFSIQNIDLGIQGFGKFGTGSYVSEGSAFIPLKERLQLNSDDDSSFMKGGDVTFFSWQLALRASYQKMHVALGYEMQTLNYEKLFRYKYKKVPVESVFLISGFHIKTQFDF